MPLILHNVPDEERYVGDDGLTRPYAMLFAQYVFASICLYLGKALARLPQTLIANMPVNKKRRRSRDKHSRATNRGGNRLIWQVDAAFTIAHRHASEGHQGESDARRSRQGLWRVAVATEKRKQQ